MVDTHDKHRGICTGGRDDDSLGTTLNVSLAGESKGSDGKCTVVFMTDVMTTTTYRSLLNGGENTSRLHNICSTCIAPFNVGWIPPAWIKMERSEHISLNKSRNVCMDSTHSLKTVMA